MNLHRMPGPPSDPPPREGETPLETCLRAEADVRRAAAPSGLAADVVASLASRRTPETAVARTERGPRTLERARLSRAAVRLPAGAGWLAAAAAVLILFGTRDRWLDAPPPPPPTTPANLVELLGPLGIEGPSLPLGLDVAVLARAASPVAAALGEEEVRTRVEEPLRAELDNLRRDGRSLATAYLGGLPDPLGRLFSGS